MTRKSLSVDAVGRHSGRRGRRNSIVYESIGFAAAAAVAAVAAATAAATAAAAAAALIER
eukprot:4261146-Prymnesium_polylepis.1